MVTRQALTALASAFGRAAPIDLSPENPFLVSVDEAPASVRFGVDCPLSGVRQVARLPLADALTAPVDTGLDFPTDVVPSFHGGLVSIGADRELVSRALRGGTVPDGGLWRAAYDAISWAASAWAAPGLDVGRASAPKCPARHGVTRPG
ncbi:MAG TPA: hypothetical protein VMF60_09075 [Acidimicrobiales bacterium]|nr:hypothetical protein [Acidimicrobiales bacterium]